MKTIVFLWLFLSLSLGAQASIQQELESTGIRYFIDNAHPATGLVLDKASNFDSVILENRVASIAATGFGLAVIANAAQRGLVDRKIAEVQILKTLKFARDHVPRHRGWFLHWVDWETGTRVWQCEFSTIDTALFMAGALYAAEIFRGEVSDIARKLYRDIDFHFFLTDDGKKPNKRTLTLSFKHEEGFVPYQWEVYSEQHILLLLGLGHPTRPLPSKVWKAWRRYNHRLAVSKKIMGYEMPIFVHQYSQVFVDFRRFHDGYPNYFENGVRATKAHRHLRTSEFWGLSAGEDPEGYRVYTPTEYKSTICIGCAVASVMYMPKEILADMEGWFEGSHRKKIWGKYGFIDSLNLERNWYSPYVLGITVGPAYLSLANLKRETSVWKDFMKIPEIKRALRRAEAF